MTNTDNWDISREIRLKSIPNDSKFHAEFKHLIKMPWEEDFWRMLFL